MVSGDGRQLRGRESRSRVGPRSPVRLLVLAAAWLASGCAGTIIYNSSPNPTTPSVVVLTHYDKTDYEEKCAPLLYSLQLQRVNYIVGYLNESAFPGRERRHAECAKSDRCVEREEGHVFNNQNKFVWAYEVVTQLAAIHPDSLVIFADCTDVYLMCSADELERKFESFGAEIVHGAELKMWPFDRLHRMISTHRLPDPYPEAPTPIRYGNTGQYAGRARQVRAYFERQRLAWEDGTPWSWCCPTGVRFMYPKHHPNGPALPAREMEETDCFNDQRCIHTYVAAGFHNDGLGPRMVFDSMSDMFLNANRLLHRISTHGARVSFNLSQAAEALRKKRARRAQVWRAPKEASLPCWLHCSGSSKKYFEPLTRVLMAASRPGAVVRSYSAIDFGDLIAHPNAPF
ncbi:hypothetical protein T492DRAFT_990038 [Pavlovales sp. CCMP2436]|nr:hypothetical protein T492DRAFT_990038 [Pavlovales sp. CCMP2436]